MRVWLYRWPNGDCAIVWAASRIDALQVLDQIGDAETNALIPLHPGAIDLHLKDDGELQLGELTDHLQEQIDEAYPILQEYRNGLCQRDMEISDDEAKREISRAVAIERKRLWNVQPKQATTPEARALQKELAISGELADRYVLENYKGTKH